MEQSILESLTYLGYDGPLSDSDVFSMALNNGPKSLGYMQLVHILSEELQELCHLKKRVNYITNPNNSSAFMLELSFFLKELNCPYKSLTTDGSRLQTKRDRLLLLDFLISELMAAKIVKMDWNKEELTPDTAIDMDESPTARDIKEILIMLKINRPPVFITSNMLFTKLEARLKEYIQKEGHQLVGKPLYMRDQAPTEYELRQLEDTFNDLVVDYTQRRKAMIKRLDCTMIRFELSTRVPTTRAVRSAYHRVRSQLEDKPSVDLVDVLAARSWLLKESNLSTTVRKKVHDDVKEVIIREVDGRPNTVCENNDDYNMDMPQESPQTSQSVASQNQSNRPRQEYPQIVSKQKPNGCDENAARCSDNQDFCKPDLDEDGYIQGYSLGSIKQEADSCYENQNLKESGYLHNCGLNTSGGLLKSEAEPLKIVKIEEETSTNPDILPIEINIDKTSNLSIMELNNSKATSFPSSEKPHDLVYTSKCKIENFDQEVLTNEQDSTNHNNNKYQQSSTKRLNPSNVDNNSPQKASTKYLPPLTDDTWSNWEPDNLPDSNWLFDGPKIIKQGITTYKPLVLKMINITYRFLSGAALGRLFKNLERNIDFHQALALANKPTIFTPDTLVNVTVNNRPFQCNFLDTFKMYRRPDSELYTNPYIPILPYVVLPQRKKKNQEEETITDEQSAAVKISFSDEDSENEPPQKVPKIEPGLNRVGDVQIRNIEPMTPKQLNLISVAILHELHKISPRPKIIEWNFFNSCITVTCANETSRDWLQALIPQLKPWPEAQLSGNEVEKTHEIEDTAPPMIIKYIYTRDRLYFIDVTKTDEYHGVYIENKPDSENFAKIIMFHKPRNKRKKDRGFKAKKMKRRAAMEAARLAAETVKGENCNSSEVKVKIEPQDSNYDYGNNLAGYSTQMHIKTEQEIKTELLEVD